MTRKPASRLASITVQPEETEEYWLVPRRLVEGLQAEVDRLRTMLAQRQDQP